MVVQTRKIDGIHIDKVRRFQYLIESRKTSALHFFVNINMLYTFTIK